MGFGTTAAMAAPAIINTIGNAITGKNNRRHSVDMWKMEQEYNKPVNQMARLENAGINPHLAFSSGNINNVASSAPQTMAIMPGQLSTADMMTDKNRKSAEADIALKEAQEWLTDRKVQEQLSRNQIAMVESAIELARFPGEGPGDKKWDDAVAEFASQRQLSNLTEEQAREVVAKFRERMANKNMITGDNPILRALMGIAEYFGFNFTVE